MTTPLYLYQSDMADRYLGNLRCYVGLPLSSAALRCSNKCVCCCPQAGTMRRSGCF